MHFHQVSDDDGIFALSRAPDRSLALKCSRAGCHLLHSFRLHRGRLEQENQSAVHKIYLDSQQLLVGASNTRSVGRLSRLVRDLPCDVRV